MTPKSILVIDDDTAILAMIADLLLSEGYQVRTTNQGSDAIAYAQADPPALILLDLMMPQMSGWQVISALRAEPTTSDIPVVLLSARRDLTTTAKELGITSFLEKPFDLDELLSIVERYSSIAPCSHKSAN